MCYKVDDDPEKNFQGIKIAVYIVNPINNLFELHFSNNALICPNFISENSSLTNCLTNP